MKVDRKKFYIINSIVIAVILLIIGITFIANSANDAEQRTSVSKVQAYSFKKQAIEALKSNDTVKARTLFQKAKEQYLKLGNSVDVVDMEAQIYLIDHPKAKE